MDDRVRSGLRRLIGLRFPGLRWVETARLAEWMEGGLGAPLLLLDARAAEEYEVSHLAGAVRVDPEPRNLEPSSLPAEARVVVYCSLGYRSGAVARRLAAAGVGDVHNLEGGIFQWANEGRALYRGGERVQQVHPYDRTWGRLLDARLHPDA